VQRAHTGLAKREAQTCGSEAARDEKRASVTAWWNRDDVNTPPQMLPVIPAVAKNKPKRHETLRRADETSGSHTGSARRNDTIPQKVISIL
jgi:hypothetical protein